MAEAATPYRWKRRDPRFEKPLDLDQRRIVTPEDIDARTAQPWSYKRTKPYRYFEALLDYYRGFLDRLGGIGQ